MKKIVFATGNQGKLREVKKILADLNVDIVSMKEEGIQIDVDENGTTFAENAQIKATAIGAHTDAIVLADDSGLVIDALNGEVLTPKEKRDKLYKKKKAGKKKIRL